MFILFQIIKYDIAFVFNLLKALFHFSMHPKLFMANFTDCQTVTMTSTKSLNNQIHSHRNITLYNIRDIYLWFVLDENPLGHKKAMNNGL